MKTNEICIKQIQIKYFAVDVETGNINSYVENFNNAKEAVAWLEARLTMRAPDLKRVAANFESLSSSPVSSG